MNHNSPQPPERPLLELLAERNYIDRRAREITKEVTEARGPGSLEAQEARNNSLRKMLQQMSDKRNGH